MPVLNVRPEEALGLCDDQTTGHLALGCPACPEFSVCGGLRTASGFLSCDELCLCKDNSPCNYVCRKRPANYFRRFKEVNSFELSTIPRVQGPASSPLPSVVPYLDPKRITTQLLPCEAVAVSLYDLVWLGTGHLKDSSRLDLTKRFGVHPGAAIIASGVAKDDKIERWWTMPDRAAASARLKDLGIDCVTVPNFSLFTDAPREDNLYSMKRIAIVCSEFMKAGVNAALHANARTTFDYNRLATYIAPREEIHTLAFEFGTGCGNASRIDWHVTHLCQLADFVGRPLSLVVRGGILALSKLRQHFSDVTFIDTDSLMRTIKRRRGIELPNGRLKWIPSPTRPGEPLDELLSENIRTVARVRAPSQARTSIKTPLSTADIGLRQSVPDTVRAER